MKDIKDVSPGTPDGCEECLKARSRWLHLRYLIDRIEALPNVEIHRSAQINALEGDNRLRTVSIRRADGSEMRIRCGSLFMFIGANARTGWLKECVQLDDKGFVVTGTALRAPAAGDVRSGSI